MTTLAELLGDIEQPSITPTPEQQAIINAALNTTDNILISALAGAAKTTTLELICKALPVQPILSLAFNKRIAEEMKKKLPGHVQAMTLNSVGHRVWMKCCTGKINLNTNKNADILKGFMDGLSPRQRSEAWERFGENRKAIAKAKISGYIPDGKYPKAKRLITTDEFWSQFDDDEVDRGLIEDSLTESIRQAYSGHIDFDDQIFMSTLFGSSFPQFPLVMCDEVQDLSAINQEMLERLVTQRLIAVGDHHQSIYRFRGAVSSGMVALREKFNMTEMGLSISFRCPIAVIENARFRAPHMQWPDWAKPGAVIRKEVWNAEDIEDGAAIICRNNAPLFSLAFRLLRRGRGIKLVGFDIGPNLIRTLKKLGDERMTRLQVLQAIDKWEEEKLATKKQVASTADKAEALRALAESGETLAEIIARTEDLFKRSGPIQLLSGHKAKGLEWDHVYHLDPHRIPSTYAISDEDVEQEMNVKYVIETRAKDTLYFVDLRDFDKEEGEE